MLFFQLFLIGAWMSHGAYLSIGFLGVNSLILLGFYLYLRKPFFSLIELNKEGSNLTDKDPEAILKWKKLYRHPLILKDEESPVPPVAVRGRTQTWIAKEKGNELNIEMIDNRLTQRNSLIANY